MKKDESAVIDAPPKFALPEKFKAYTIVQIDAYNWSIVELKISGNRVEKWHRDVESTKEIKAERLVDLVVTGRSLENVV